MILTTEQQRRITDAGGWGAESILCSSSWQCIVWLPGNVTVEQQIDVWRVRHYVPADGSWTTHMHHTVSDVVNLALVVSRDAVGDAFDQVSGHAGDHKGCPCLPAPPCNVLQFPLPSTTRLGAVENWLDGHADAVGAAVMKAVYRLANLARRADNARKGRRNG